MVTIANKAFKAFKAFKAIKAIKAIKAFKTIFRSSIIIQLNASIFLLNLGGVDVD